VGLEQQTRLRVHYVAMTRPTHLLCLAMKKNSRQGGNANSHIDIVEKLQSRGWYISDLTTGESRVPAKPEVTSDT
jgi:ATP-dependent exoDNAse (exonuclease V) beta subunit